MWRSLSSISICQPLAMQTEFMRDTFNQWQISHRLTGWLILKCMLQIHWEPSIEINESEIPVGQCTSIMCNYLLRLMLINDKLNTFIICFYVMMNEHNVHFRSRYKALHTHTRANWLLKCMFSVRFERQLGKTCSSSVHVAPLSVQYLLTQPIQQESIDAVTHLVSSNPTSFLSLSLSLGVSRAR